MGQTWLGATVQPLPKYYRNFAVVSTDYENYAILYQCTQRTVMYNKDMITVISRQPNFSQLESGTEEKIKSEFNRIFGPQPDNEMQGIGPLVFEEVVSESSHQECEYPDLNLTIG